MLMGFLCRICRCLGRGPRDREASAEAAGDAVAEERTGSASEARGRDKGRPRYLIPSPTFGYSSMLVVSALMSIGRSNGTFLPLEKWGLVWTKL